MVAQKVAPHESPCLILLHLSLFLPHLNLCNLWLFDLWFLKFCCTVDYGDDGLSTESSMWSKRATRLILPNTLQIVTSACACSEIPLKLAYFIPLRNLPKILYTCKLVWSIYETPLPCSCCNKLGQGSAAQCCYHSQQGASDRLRNQNCRSDTATCGQAFGQKLTSFCIFPLPNKQACPNYVNV